MTGTSQVTKLMTYNTTRI